MLSLRTTILNYPHKHGDVPGDVEHVNIPISKISCIVLGPGTSITHAALSTISSVGSNIVWTGEQMRVFYASGIGETRSSKNLLLQAEHCMDSEKHIEVVRNMYKMRFPKDFLADKMTIEQMRGLEGVRMKSVYQIQAARTGVKWKQRKYNAKDLSDADEVNQALSIANVLLYAMCHSAIVALGFSPGLGFIHTGNALSFVYDIADLYKAKTTIPAAFDVAKKYKWMIENELEGKPFDMMVREKCREYFVKENVLGNIATDIFHIFGKDVETDTTESINQIWERNFEVLQGGLNYAYQYEEEQAW